MPPDALTSLGGYPGDDGKGLALFSKLDRAKMTGDFLAAADWLKARPDSRSKLGAVGFCFGGGVVNQLTKYPSVSKFVHAEAQFGTDRTRRVTADYDQPISERFGGTSFRLNVEGSGKIGWVKGGGVLTRSTVMRPGPAP